METSKPLHIGRKISRLRELRGMKQEALADALGVSQQTVSRIESSEAVADDMLEKVSRALEVSIDTIKNFNEEAIINYVSSFNDSSVNNGAIYSFNSTFNPIDKLLEAYEENKKLYERLLDSEKDKVRLLEEVLRGR